MHLRIVKSKFMHPEIGATVVLHPLMIFLMGVQDIQLQESSLLCQG